MRFSQFTLLTLLGASLSAAVPDGKEFLLVTTDQSEPAAKASDLRNVLATLTWETPDQPLDFDLQIVRPDVGIYSLPNFTITDGYLRTYVNLKGSEVWYYGFLEGKNTKLLFLPWLATAELGLEKEYLLSLNGETKGWAICGSQSDREVLWWKPTDTKCRPTYLQAVTTLPYQ